MSKNISLLLFSADELLLPRTCPQLLCSIPTSPILPQKILSYVLSRPFVFPLFFFAPFPIFWCTAGCGAGLQSWWCRKKGRFVIQPEPANKYQEHTLLLFSFSDSILSFFSIPWNLSLLISINFKNE